MYIGLLVAGLQMSGASRLNHPCSPPHPPTLGICLLSPPPTPSLLWPNTSNGHRPIGGRLFCSWRGKDIPHNYSMKLNEHHIPKAQRSHQEWCLERVGHFPLFHRYHPMRGCSLPVSISGLFSHQCVPSSSGSTETTQGVALCSHNTCEQSKPWQVQQVLTAFACVWYSIRSFVNVWSQSDLRSQFCFRSLLGEQWGQFLNLSVTDLTSLNLNAQLDAVWHGSFIFEKVFVNNGIHSTFWFCKPIVPALQEPFLIFVFSVINIPTEKLQAGAARVQTATRQKRSKNCLSGVWRLPARLVTN